MATQQSIFYDRVWLFSKPANRKLIISAHGRAPTPRTKFTCPGPDYNQPLIYKTSSDGLCTTTQVDDIVKWANAGARRGDAGNVWQTNPFSGEQTNWLLSKYAKTEGDATDGFFNYRDTYRGYLAVAEFEGFDVASPRNRWFMIGRNREIRLSDVLSAIPRKGKYQQIWFSFCSFVKEGYGTS